MGYLFSEISLRVFKKPDFSEKSGFSEKIMSENIWKPAYFPMLCVSAVTIRSG